MRKSLSFSENVLILAQDKAKRYFNNNLSSYLAFLIVKDNENNDTSVQNKNS